MEKNLNDKKFAYYKLEFTDLDVIRESLTPEQGMALICAIVDYAKDGTIAEVPPEAKIFFSLLRKKQDQAKNKYDELCAKRAESGKKGGKAKAKNAAKAEGPTPDQATKFKPPTLSQFKNAVKKIADEYDWDRPNDYDMEAFYDHLNESHWLFKGMPIQSRSDWEEIITAKFALPSDLYVPNVCYAGMCYLISEYPQLHHQWSEIDEITDQLCESWDEKRGAWVIDGREFQRGNFQAVLDLIVGEWLKEIPPLANASTC